jgi:hypothetical protein
VKKGLLFVAVALAVMPVWADGAAEPDRAGIGEMGDPYVPAMKRHASTEAPTSGAALQGQVEEKLRRQFAAADVGGTGWVTKEQAQQAGWGYLVRHFEQVDTAGRGSVSFEQVREYQRAAWQRAGAPRK